MSKRHDDALAIIDGACNLSGIAHSLIRCVQECRDEGVDPNTDAAIRLIVSQMANIAHAGSPDLRDFDKIMTECEEKSPERQAKLQRLRKVAEAYPGLDVDEHDFILMTDHRICPEAKIHIEINLKYSTPRITFHARRFDSETSSWNPTGYGLIGEERKEAHRTVSELRDKIQELTGVDFVGVQATDDPGMF